jgi:hypothetical protein
MANPQVNQGTLNRLRGSVTFADFPSLNISADQLVEAGIDLSFEGKQTDFVPTLTGAVTSPAPYQVASLTIHLNKALPIADQYKQQGETSTPVGDLTFRTDSSNLGPYQLTNCALQGPSRIVANGKDADYPIVITGYYQINSTLWN